MEWSSGWIVVIGMVGIIVLTYVVGIALLIWDTAVEARKYYRRENQKHPEA
jgi:Ni/Fe-hydrogenase subunit HybB-like protein